MQLSLYIDEDAMDTDLVQALRLRGIDVTTPRESGTTGHSDEEQLEFATAQGRALYSFNIRDYMPIHSRFLNQGEIARGDNSCGATPIFDWRATAAALGVGGSQVWPGYARSNYVSEFLTLASQIWR